MSGSIRDQPFVEQLKGFFFLGVALAGFCQERLTYRHLSLDGQYAGVENARVVLERLHTGLRIPANRSLTRFAPRIASPVRLSAKRSPARYTARLALWSHHSQASRPAVRGLPTST